MTEIQDPTKPPVRRRRKPGRAERAGDPSRTPATERYDEHPPASVATEERGTVLPPRTPWASSVQSAFEQFPARRVLAAILAVGALLAVVHVGVTNLGASHQQPLGSSTRRRFAHGARHEPRHGSPAEHHRGRASRSQTPPHRMASPEAPRPSAGARRPVLEQPSTPVEAPSSESTEAPEQPGGGLFSP
jgi:hypothetical protein